jgi:hypothetical protein
VALAAACLLAVGVLAACGGSSVAVPGPGGGAAGASGCAGAGSGDVIVSFRAPNGSCVPPEELLMQDCGSRVPPMIIRGAGSSTSSHRFVGGRFAVTVSELPPGARPLGSAADRQIFAVPGDPAWLFVRVGGLVQRWLPLPREPLVSQPSAVFIGDSITLGAEPWILEALPDWTTAFDAEIGRGSATGVSIAPSVAAIAPDVAVVELGTNDADADAFREHVRTTLEMLRDVPLVVWQTIRSFSDLAPEINLAIHEEVRLYPNTVLADWESFVGEDVLDPDGVHPLPEHEDEMARLIAPFLVHWLMATRQTGLGACLDGMPTT